MAGEWNGKRIKVASQSHSLAHSFQRHRLTALTAMREVMGDSGRVPSAEQASRQFYGA